MGACINSVADPTASWASISSEIALDQRETRRSFPNSLVSQPVRKTRNTLVRMAVLTIAVGLVKKIVISAYLSINLVDRVFDAPAQFSALACDAAVLAFAVQIYCAVAGCAVIAIGCAARRGGGWPECVAAR